MADKSLTKTQIYAALAEKTGLDKKQVSDFLETFIALAYEEAKTNGRFNIPGLGILKLDDRPERMGRNPATGEQIKIAAKKSVKFSLAKACKEAIIPPTK